MKPNNRLTREVIWSAMNEQQDPPRERPELWVLRMKAQQLRTFLILSSKWWGVWTHYDGKTGPCFRTSEHCVGCARGKKKEWKAYLHCHCLELKQDVILELPRGAALSLRDQLGKDVSLRGNRVQVKKGKGATSGLQVSILTACQNLNDLAAEKDPRPSVWALWGCELPPVLADDGELIPEPSANGFH